MNAVLISQECHPFAKASGLADFTYTLAKEMERLGHNVTVLLPRYGFIDPVLFHIERLPTEFKISFNETQTNIILYKGVLPDSLVSIFFIESQNYFSNSKEIYSDEERNKFFALAALNMISKLKFEPNIIHLLNAGAAHTAKILRSKNIEFANLNKTGLIFTIYNSIGLKDGGLKAANEAIRLSDLITTSSNAFREELLSDDKRISKIGLSEALSEKKDLFFGIQTGIDNDLYNPEKGNEIPQLYSKNYFSIGKRKCKEDLLDEVKLEKNLQVPLFAFVDRLIHEKGLEILIDALPQINHLNMQLVIYGKGLFEEELIKTTERYKNIKVYQGNNPNITKKIYGGSDFFISTSKCEANGNSLLCAMKYGCIPIAHFKGAIKDIVVDFDQHEEGNGIIFSEFDEVSLIEAINKAIKHYKNKEKWPRLVKQTMSFNINPQNMAKEYVNLYMKIFCNEVINC